jgi:L-ascorbate metabolism protein UlaG (beta-lactamase superfamily)
MDPREAGVACELLGVKRVVPCHWGTFPLLAGTPDELKKHAPGGVQIDAVDPGGSVTL